MKRIFIPIISLVFLAFSCASPKGASEGKSVLKKIEKKEGLHFQELNTKLNINFPELKNTVDALIKIKNSDTITIDIFGPFGVKFGKLWSDRNGFVFLNYFQSVAFTGTPTAENFKTAAMIDLSFDDLIAMMRAEPIADISEYSLIKNQENTGVYGRTIGKTAEFLVVNTDKNNIEQYQRQNEYKETILNVYLQEYSLVSGFELPGKIVADLPEQNASLSFDIKERKINIELTGLEKPSLPSSFKVIDVDSIN